MSIVVKQSESLLSESKKYLAGGVASTLRASMKPTPLFAEAGSGPRVRDVDGNEYIDYLLAYGPLILGHAHPSLAEGLNDALKRGVTFGLQHTGEIELAKLLTEILPCADRVALSGSGTEAVMLALRLSRAYTGRTKVIRFHGHFHGWSDAIFTSFPSADMKQSETASAGAVPPGTGGQSENSLQDIILLPWNDIDALEETLRREKDSIAAVITEPIMCNNGCIHPMPGYLERMRELTEEFGIVMIMDEVITGFRLGLGGAHGKLGLKPDLVTIGKAMGGGIAISGVAGKADIMAMIEKGTVGHLGTLNGNVAATSAALATLRELAKDGGSVYGKMERTADLLVQGINSLFEKHRVPGLVNQAGPVFHVMFTSEEKVENFDAFNKRDAAKYSRFAELMLAEGVLIRPSGLWYVSAVHGEDEVRATLTSVDRVLANL
ncbi:aspartate aminotransferase family protein [Cohnella herbarum]|uniref:Aspartate aminotransferase family protein n=1 Tax=Cohnella herbarum TaxID=2728023 RepID=A0A7Z2VNK6_9BACL|nr:aspartate aminotransferase family protein [Cohnella herbarum]QJD86368.1 aspartate aminotransferase family protein [Cohnella herbarum]